MRLAARLVEAVVVPTKDDVASVSLSPF